MSRDLDSVFLSTMRQKLEHGRKKGLVGWEQCWHDCVFESPPDGPTGLLMQRLQEEVIELAIAIAKDDKEAIRNEAADVANFAMMVADYHDALKNESSSSHRVGTG